MRKTKIFRSNKGMTQKQVQSKRNILAFLLFFCIVMFCACVFGGLGIGNSKEIASAFLESSYINELTNDVHQYASDLCEEAGVPKKVVDESVTYNKMYEFEKSYIYTSLFQTDEYNENAFLANVLHLKGDIDTSLRTALEENDVTITPQMQKDIDELTTNISNYAKQRIRFENEDLYIKILHTAKIVNIVLIALTVASSALILARLLNIGNKKYRSLRYAVYSFCGAALYNFMTSIVFRFVEQNNEQIIYPSYLQGAISSYTQASFHNFNMLSLIVLFASVCVAAIVWILKKKDI